MLTGLFVAPTAHAASLTEAASHLGITGRYQLDAINKTGDVTRELIAATKTAASAATPRIVTLPSGSLRITAQIRMANNVYVVAQPGTTVVLSGSADQLLWFNQVTGGVYGGTWDAARKASSVIGAKSSTLRLVGVSVRNAAKNGLSVYAKSHLTMTDVSSTANANDGLFAQASTVRATRVRATDNRRNGMQLSEGTTGTVADSTLDHNGLAVTGSTTGKVGHGLGVASSRATVTNTRMSSNKVCGLSLSGDVDATVSGATLSGNGRHGVGTTPSVKVSISDSVVANNGYNGVLASGSGTQVRLDGVTISGTAKHGLSVPSKGSAWLRNSTITTSRSANVSVSAKGVLTIESGNRIANGRADGITVTQQSRLTISGAGNSVATNASNGLVVSGKGTSGRITHSVVFDTNRQHGILVKAKGKLVTVANRFINDKLHAQSGGKVSKLG